MRENMLEIAKRLRVRADRIDRGPCYDDDETDFAICVAQVRTLHEIADVIDEVLEPTSETLRTQPD